MTALQGSIQLLRKTRAELSAMTDPLLAGQVAIESESGLTKTGPGVWSTLEYDLAATAVKDPYIANSYFAPFPFGTVENQGIITSSSSSATPFKWCFNKTITRVLIDVTTGSPGSISRASIYEVGADGIPSNLIYDLGQFSTGSSGSVIITGLSLNLVLNKTYAMVFSTNAASIGIRGMAYYSRQQFLSGGGRFLFTSPGIGAPSDPFVPTGLINSATTYSPTLQFGFF